MGAPTDEDRQDWEALRELTTQVSAGRAIPAALQTRANIAMARAMTSGKFPKRPAGRPKRAAGVIPGRQLKAALGVVAWQDGGLSRPAAVAAVADAQHLEDSTVQKYARKHAEAARALLDPEVAGALDLVEPGEVVEAVNDARQRVVASLFDNVSPPKG